tara:strand:- start:235 stop:765 length:531 start_codon:yes stop_codon:yes gene_type:complete
MNTDNLLNSIYLMNKNIYEKLTKVEDKLNKLEDNIKVIESKINNTSIINTRNNFKKEKFEFEESIIKTFLEKNSLSGDFEMFQLMYYKESKESYPIKKISDNKYQYWNNNIWNDDNLDSIKSILIYNIRYCYLKVNKYDDYKENSDKFIKNQEHINKLSDSKYVNKLLSYIFKKIN